MAELTPVTRENFEENVLKAELPVCVFFNAPWCKRGAEMIDTVKAAADEVGDKMPFFAVDTDAEEVIIVQQKVPTIPMVRFLSKGKPVGELRGVVSTLDLLGKVSAILTEPR